MIIIKITDKELEPLNCVEQIEYIDSVLDKSELDRTKYYQSSYNKEEKCEEYRQ